MNTVAVIEAGIGAMSLGFMEAGFQVKEVFTKDRKAIAIHKKNIESKIYERGLLELLPEEISDVDVIAIDSMQMFSFQSDGKYALRSRQFNEEPLKRIVDIIKWKNPRIFSGCAEKNV